MNAPEVIKGEARGLRTVVVDGTPAIDEQRLHVADLELDYEAGYLDGLVRALAVVQTKAHGVPTGAEST